MPTVTQRSFSGGEISPSLYARVDTAKYATGVRTLRNMIVMRHGGAQNRPGFKFIKEVADSTKTTRLIEFIFNADQTYILEFGDETMRVFKDGVQQTDLTLTITGITNANPAVVTYTGTDPSSGDEVFIEGIAGGLGEYLNNRNFLIANVDAGNNTFELQYKSGTNVNSTAMGSWSSGGTAKRVYELATPYAETDLSSLKYVQSGDVITFAHPSYAPYELSRTGDTSWTIEPIELFADIAAPSDVVHAGATSTVFTVTNVTTANPAVFTTATHSYNTNDIVQISNIWWGFDPGAIETRVGKIPTATYKITVLSTTTFSAVKTSDGTNLRIPSGYDWIDNASYRPKAKRVETASGTPAFPYEYVVTSVNKEFQESEPSASVGTTDAPSTGSPGVISWTAVTGAESYNVYKRSQGVYGFIGNTTYAFFRDTGITANTDERPPERRNLFLGSNDFPSAVGYVQQRLTFANTNNEPEKIWMSRTGKFKSFMVSTPSQDDDSVAFNLAGKNVNEIKHLLEIGRPIIFTSGGEWSLDGNGGGTITPFEINPKQHTYNGSGDLRPIVIDGSAVYVQARGSIIRDLLFSFQTDGYSGSDLTIFSAHLFDGYTIVAWAYQQSPHSVLWAVRNDGVLLGLTYVREQQMLAWHRHDTDGTVVDINVVPEGTEDAVYILVERTIDGSTKKYIERLTNRYYGDIEDAVFVDSSYSRDGRHTGATTMTLSGGTTWAYDETLTLTASAGTFTTDYVGDQIHITGSDGSIIRFTIDAYTSTTVVTGRPNKTVPASMRSTAISTWSHAIDRLTGLWHLEGEDVSVFADGFVVANPNNDSYDTVTVTNGVAQLDKPYAVINVGFPYLSDVETLDIDTPNGETVSDKHKNISRVSMYVESSRGIWAGSATPVSSVKDGLYELKIRNDENYDSPVELKTDVVTVNIQPEWNSNGRVFVRQIDPVPLTILSVMPTGAIPFRR
jgi:hypothetical protein